MEASLADQASRMLTTADFELRTASRIQWAAGQQTTPKRSWIGRHPVLTGTLIGFTTGFLIGYLPGDDAVFYDFTATFNGFVMGGIGAGAGALTGAVISAVRK